MGILTSRHFITSCEVLPLLSFLGRVFGELRLLGMFPVSFGMLLGIASLRVIILTGDNLRLKEFDFMD